MSQQGWFDKATVQGAVVGGVITGIFIIAGIILTNIFLVPRLQDRITQLEDDNSKKDKEIQQLETQLVPFKTFALEKYAGSEHERLQKLAQDLEALQKKMDPMVKPIASAESYSEITIRSDKNLNFNYMDRGGYVAFAKGSSAILMTSGTQSEVSSKDGKSIYSGHFLMRPDDTAIGNPVNSLKSSEYIQIFFNQIPPNSEIIEGKVNIVINGELRFTFPIPAQTMSNEKIFTRNIKEVLSEHEKK